MRGGACVGGGVAGAGREGEKVAGPGRQLGRQVGWAGRGGRGGVRCGAGLGAGAGAVPALLAGGGQDGHVTHSRHPRLTSVTGVSV